MAKKKKTQLKPVARGFATTSVPKKVVPVEEEEIDVPIAGTDLEETKITEEGSKDGPVTAQGGAESEFDPDKVDEQSLQNLVDKLQEKTEKEIMR